MRHDLPAGTVTFVFTDVEGSTRLLAQLGDEGYAAALAEHRHVVTEACAARAGVVVDTEGDAFFVAFQTAPEAIEAAEWIQNGSRDGSIRVRIGLHTGTPVLTDDGYIGLDVHRAARIAAAAHGGQIVVSTSVHALAGGRTHELRDLGEHRLKDLSAPERLYQVGEKTFPPLRTLPATNLPVPSTPFLGRAEELAAVTALLAEGGPQLVTLTGPGGTGKTRLALQAAADVSEGLPGGVWWIPLAPVRDASLFLPTVAQALDVPEEHGQPLVETLAGRLAGRHLLLVLDNVEHLLPVLAGDLAALLSGCSSLRVLATSRERVQIAAETTWPVPPLSRGDAEPLFVERATAAGVLVSRDETTEELCRRLDDLPLAIELAAARTVVFSPAQLLERLGQRLDLLKGGRDADPRQQTLRATIDWSYDLLAPEEQDVLCKLAVFAGGCTYAAAEDVAGADADTLQSLLDKSLLRRRDTSFGPRYWLLELIRSYAAEKLEGSGAAHVSRRRHAEWYCRFAHETIGFSDQLLPVTSAPDTMRLFREDYDNVRLALGWAWASGEDDLGLELGAASCRYWLGAGLYRDATSWLHQATGRFDGVAPHVRLEGLKAAGIIAFFVEADTAAADELWADAAKLADELGRAEDAAWLELRRGGAAWERGDFETALASHRHQLERHRAQGNRVGEADALHLLGEALRDLGSFDEAKDHLEAAGAIYRSLGAKAPLKGNTHSLGDLALDCREYVTAIGLYRESMAIAPGEADRILAYCLAGIASALAGLGSTEDAARTWGAVCAAEETLGFRMLRRERRRYEAHLTRLESSAAWAAGRELSLGEAVVSLPTLT